MRIRCERCKAEYEVDETQMRGGHLEVQCSVCTHVFTVSKQAGAKPSPAPEERPWFVQLADGNIRRFAKQTDLLRSIQEGRLRPQDKLTQDQRTWEALADVAEFAPYFANARTGAALEPQGCEPQESASPNETSRFVLEPKSHGMLKISVGLAVAAGVAFAGIRWQQERSVRFQSRQAVAAPAPIRSAAPPLVPDTASTKQAGPGPAAVPASRAGRRPVVEALPSPPSPPVAQKEPPAPPPAAAPPAHAAESYDKLVAEGDRALENGGTNRARELYQKSLNLRPTGFKAMVGLGFVALDRGQLPMAYDYFKRALTAKTSYPPALFGIAEVHRARGEKSLALHSYQRYLDMSPDGADAPAARRQVQNLQAGR
jgi:predicted Zn finger-like uncharacterized protein